MPSDKYSVLSLMAKDIIDIRTGQLLNGRSHWLFNDTSCLLTGVSLAGEHFIPRAGIKSYVADVIVVDDLAETSALLGHDLIGLPVINEVGTIIANIIDLAIDSEGTLLEFLVTGGTVGRQAGQPVVLSMGDNYRLGRDAVLVAGTTDQVNFSPADPDLYQEALKPGRGQWEKAGGQKSEDLINRLGEQLNDLGEKITDRVKNANTDDLLNDFNRVTSKINAQLGDFFDRVVEKTSRDRHERDIEVVMEDLGGQTVSRPIMDGANQAIITPGETITVQVVKEIILADKITELYRMATSVHEEGNNRDDLKDQ